MKKTTISNLMSITGVQSLTEKRLHTLRGGCSEAPKHTYYASKYNDDRQNDDENGYNGGGEEGFIPPPGT